MYSNIVIKSTGAVIGELIPMDQAVQAGLYSAKVADADGYESLAVSHRAPVDSAIAAARLALAKIDPAEENFTYVSHSSTAYQGLDYWSPTPYIQAETVGGQASPLEIKQNCNGAMSAIHLLSRVLTASDHPESALITAADRYALPDFDRYNSDKGLPRGDGAVALVLSNSGTGVARVLSTCAIGDVGHERMYRGTSEWGDQSWAHGRPVDLRIRLKEYFSTGADRDDIVRVLDRGMERVITTLLADAGCKAGDIERFVFSNSGDTLVDWNSRREKFGITRERTTWPAGRKLGHMGAADQIEGLNRLLDDGDVISGDLVMLIGIGGGFSFSGVLVEIA
ncbi:hypothetical protein GCM10009551_078620 [Nocardiopsis tropica]